MGAYYTREDITGYISKNTIIPFIFDRTRDKNAEAFEPDGPILAPAARQSRPLFLRRRQTWLATFPLPDDIAARFARCFAARRLEPARARSNTPCPRRHGARWWRVAHAMRRFAQRSWRGEVTSINDFVTYNLDICTFAQRCHRDTARIRNCCDLLRELSNQRHRPRPHLRLRCFSLRRAQHPRTALCSLSHAHAGDASPMSRAGAPPATPAALKPAILARVNQHYNRPISFSSPSSSTTSTAWTSWRRRPKSANCASSSNWPRRSSNTTTSNPCPT